VTRVPAVVLVALVAGAVSAAELPETLPAADIPNYRVIRPDLAVGGQPSPGALARLSALGFRTVVNLRTAEEGAEEEGRTVREAGLRYVWVPVTPATLSIDDIRAVEEVLNEKDSGPVLLHCASSNRVGGVWAAIRAREGATWAEAETAGKEAGLRSPAVLEAAKRALEESCLARAAERSDSGELVRHPEDPRCIVR